MSFIKTFSGKHFYYDRINKDNIDINDIAVSLSNICRFAGHLSHFYSVAQHAVLCSQLVPQEFAFEALMRCNRSVLPGHPRATETPSS